MSDQTIPGPRKFPEKQITIRGKDVLFQRQPGRLNRSALYYYTPDTEGKDGHSIGKYPSIYSTELPGNEGFVPSWNVVREEYYENLGLINYRQYSLYNYLASLRNSGWHVSIRGNGKSGNDEVKGLAQLTDCWWPTVVKDLDHLEDALLIHRVRRPDFHGTPSEIVIHSPVCTAQLIGQTNGEWQEQAWTVMLRERIAAQTTTSRRASLMRRGTTIGKNGKAAGQKVKYSYQDRTAEADRFVFDYRHVSHAFGDFAEAFTVFAMEFFSDNFNFLYSDKSAFEHDYRKELNVRMSRWGIHDNAQRTRCYEQANKFRTIYCPIEAELCGA